MIFLHRKRNLRSPTRIAPCPIKGILFNKPPTTPIPGPPPPGCDGTPLVMTSETGYVTTPNFAKDSLYPNDLDCTWVLRGTSGKVFILHFEDFEIEESSMCDYDWLKISESSHDDPNSNGTSRNSQVLCGLMLPYDIETRSENVTLAFHSDDQVGGIGFNISFSLRSPTPHCFEDEFQCGSMECVNSTAVCDRQPDCKDGSDELLCPNASNCGKSFIKPDLVEQRIVGGEEAKEGAWPWTVSVTDQYNTHFCGATLLLPGWAITAAHCFQSVPSRNYDGLFLVAGRHTLYHSSLHEQRAEIDQVFMRRDYVYNTNANDIALVKLKEDFNMTDYVNLACLPSSMVEDGDFCWVAGWGETLDTCCAGKLKQASVPIMNTSLCKQPDYYGNRILDHMLCAGYPEGGVDACGGDSGGPLVCHSNETGTWQLQGITSWGVLCAQPQSPGVYTTVRDFLPWIQEKVAHHTK